MAKFEPYSRRVLRRRRAAWLRRNAVVVTVVGQWFRSYGNELWEFDENGLMRRREASINDVAISESDRRWRGIRPESERGVEYWTNHDMPLQ